MLLQLEANLRHLLDEINRLLGDIITKTKESDNQAKLRHADWSERHRLHVLIDAAEETLSKLPNGIFEPQFLAELGDTVETIKKASSRKNWEGIKPSLASPTHFRHTLTKLTIAEHFERQGHAVELVPKGEDASPDLKIRAIGGTEEWVFIECYQPRILDGKSKNLSSAELMQVVKRSMAKAKEQIEKKSVGMLAVSCHNQSDLTFKVLSRVMEERLAKTSRTNLAGIIITSFTTMVKREPGKLSFIPIYKIDMVPNPSYFGLIEMGARPNNNDPRLIREPLTEIDGADLVARNIYSRI